MRPIGRRERPSRAAKLGDHRFEHRGVSVPVFVLSREQ